MILTRRQLRRLIAEAVGDAKMEMLEQRMQEGFCKYVKYSSPAKFDHMIQNLVDSEPRHERSEYLEYLTLEDRRRFIYQEYDLTSFKRIADDRSVESGALLGLVDLSDIRHASKLKQKQLSDLAKSKRKDRRAMIDRIFAKCKQ